MFCPKSTLVDFYIVISTIDLGGGGTKHLEKISIRYCKVHWFQLLSCWPMPTSCHAITSRPTAAYHHTAASRPPGPLPLIAPASCRTYLVLWLVVIEVLYLR
jgi:hypothetical protein